MTLKVVGVYSTNTPDVAGQIEKVEYESKIFGEIYSGVEWKVAVPSRIVSNDRLEKLAELTKQLLDSPIAKQELECISVVPGGAITDRHYSPPMPVMRNGMQYMLRRVNEINIFTKEELDHLNEKFGTSVPGGQVGENILVSGLDVSRLSLNTILKIGDNAILRVSALRSFCVKFIGAFYRKDYFTKIDYNKFDAKKVGLATQVIQPGIIKLGDTIEIIEPENRIPLSLSNAKIKFELHDLVDPTRPPIPNTKESI